jgi:glycosyltransferase involved in cell wall biosynthesis
MTILSIAIPTYNRLTYLDKSLSRMESFPKINNLQINYCISASGCSDGTRDYLSKIHEKNYYINIKKSKRTRWNWIYLKKLIPKETDWVWLFGDDDIILHSDGWLPIQKLIETANNNNADIISIPQSKRILKEEIHIDTLINLSVRFGMHEILGWMTSIIMRRSVFINFLNFMQIRFRNVYTDRGLLVNRVSPFLHSLILLKQNSNTNMILALQHIADEQISISDKVTHTLNSRNAEFLKDRITFTFSEFKDLIILYDHTKKLSFYRYVNKTYLDLFINIIAEKIIVSKNLPDLKAEFNELLFIFERLDEKYKAQFRQKINILDEIINLKLPINYDKIKEAYNDTKRDYLGNFINDNLYNSI